MNIYKTILYTVAVIIIAAGVIRTRYTQSVAERTESDRFDSVTVTECRMNADKECAAVKEYEKETAIKTKSNSVSIAAYDTRIKNNRTDYLKTLDYLNEEDTAIQATK